MDFDDAIDYVANLLNAEASRSQGYGASARWWCLDATLKEKFRAKARKVIQEWAEKERAIKAEVDAEVRGHQR